MTSKGAESCWEAVAARLLPPAQVEIIELLSAANRPLSEEELSRSPAVSSQGGLRIRHHLRRLLNLDVVVEVNDDEAGHDRIRYRLVADQEGGAYA
jgi:hypothetical protein